jgi:hypothetical protein
MGNAYRILMGKPKEKKLLCGRIILKWLLQKQVGMIWTGFI